MGPRRNYRLSVTAVKLRVTRPEVRHEELIDLQPPRVEPVSDPVPQSVPLEGLRWPTVDPFLNCVHHVDAYPRGDGAMAPAAALTGRNIGMDFDPIDGWRMYHGSRVPGFPAHPHRGFETVTYVRHGLIDHADSLGATARYGHGDVQWLTAGAGVQHAEMFPLVDSDGPNPTELFQIWVNLPAAHKFADPDFTMFADREIPRVVHHTSTEPGAPEVRILVIAGAVDGVRPLDPPPDSWAADPRSDLAIWHVTFDPGATWTMPAAADPGVARMLYVFDHGLVRIDGHAGDITADTAIAVDAGRPSALSSPTGTEMLVLAGRPIGEPVAAQGPFVMNTRAELADAYDDYRRTQFGGWPWPTADPVHPVDADRFARHADGRREELGPARVETSAPLH